MEEIKISLSTITKFENSGSKNFEEKNYKEAIESFKEAIKNYGDLFLEIDKNNEIKKILELDTSYIPKIKLKQVDSYIFMGHSYKELAKNKEAKGYYENALKLINNIEKAHSIKKIKGEIELKKAIIFSKMQDVCIELGNIEESNSYYKKWRKVKASARLKVIETFDRNIGSDTLFNMFKHHSKSSKIGDIERKFCKDIDKKSSFYINNIKKETMVEVEYDKIEEYKNSLKKNPNNLAKAIYCYNIASCYSKISDIIENKSKPIKESVKSFVAQSRAYLNKYNGKQSKDIKNRVSNLTKNLQKLSEKFSETQRGAKKKKGRTF